MRLSGLRRLVIPAVVALLAAGQYGTAQTLRFTAGVAGAAAFQVAFLDQPTAEGRASLGLEFLPHPGLQLHLRHTTGLGPLGNIIIDVDAAGTIDGPARASLAGRASVGPVALRLRPYVTSGEPLPRLRPADQSFGPLPYSPGLPVWGVQLGASWRLNRDLMLVADPGFMFGGRGAAVLVPLELQLRALVGSHDLRLLVQTLVPLSSSPQQLTAWSAAGAGLRINRQRAAAWELWLLYGGDRESQAAGLRFNVQESVAGGTLLAGFSLEPYRSDLQPLHLQLGWHGPVDGHTLDVQFELSAPGPALSFSTSLNIPLQ